VIVLDTHALIWFLTEPEKISKIAIKTIEQELKKSELYVSSITIWEICHLIQRKRIHFSGSLEHTINTINKMEELKFVPVDNSIALKSQTLPGVFHADPADRIITATAITIGAKLVTKDAKIRKYKHVETIW
jgi:PIN domain nuclease of toxin-antitoxin system